MHIAIISSSVREGRTTHGVALAIGKRAEHLGHSVDIVDLMEEKLPPLHYTLKSQTDLSERMQQLSDRLNKSGAMIFVSPEYNGSFSPALKNMVDHFAKGPFSGKSIGVATVSVGGLAGMRAAMQMQLLILGCFGHPLPQMLLTGNVNDKVDTEGNILDEKYGLAVDRYITEFAAIAEKLQATT